MFPFTRATGHGPGGFENEYPNNPPGGMAPYRVSHSPNSQASQPTTLHRPMRNDRVDMTLDQLPDCLAAAVNESLAGCNPIAIAPPAPPRVESSEQGEWEAN